MAGKMMNSIGVFEPLQDNVDDDHRIPPSPVVHVRGLGEAVVEADLVEALKKFGNIWYEPHTFRATTCTLTFCTRSFEMENAQASSFIVRAKIGAVCTFRSAGGALSLATAFLR